MKLFELDIERPLNYCITGKFEAPSPNWMHEDFPLIDYELIVVTDGTVYLSYQNEKFEVHSGEFLLLPPGTSPDNRRKGYRPADCSFYWMHFSSPFEVRYTEPEDFDLEETDFQAVKDHILIPQMAKIPTPEKILVLMRQLQDAAKTDFPEITINYMTTTILCELYSQFYRFHLKETDEPAKRTQKQMYYDIIDYVKLNTDQNLKVVDVAVHFGYNEKYLSHLFSDIAGIPLKQFILTNKMDVANFMLTDTNKPVQDIAQALGFSDSHNFAKAYKKICGLTPSEYRNAFSKRLLFHK